MSSLIESVGLMSGAPREELRLYCVVRGDIEMPVGKLVAQAGHAFVGALRVATETAPHLAERYLADSQPKITLQAKSLAVLERAARECKDAGIIHHLVIDEGRTVFNEPTVTCLGIGPVLRDRLPKFVSKLRLY